MLRLDALTYSCSGLQEARQVHMLDLAATAADFGAQLGDKNNRIALLEVRARR